MSISGIPSSILSPHQLGASVGPPPVSPPIIVNPSPVGPPTVSPPIIVNPPPVSPPIIANPSPVGPSPLNPALKQIAHNLTSSNLSSAKQAYGTLQQDRQLSGLGGGAVASALATLLPQSPVSLEA